MGDEGFGAMCRACRFLQYLDMEECAHISDNTLISIAEFSHSIERLCLSHCELISDEGIQALAQGAAARSGKLKVLEVDNCPSISDASLTALATVNSLQRIDLYDCQGVTKPAVRHLKAQLKHAKVLYYFPPPTPPAAAPTPRQRICRCCVIL